MKKQSLLDVKEKLHKFYCYFQDDNILALSEGKKALPFAYLICQESHPDTVLLSISVDYPTCLNIAFIIMSVLEISKLALIAPFYISTALGKKYINEEAFERWEIETLELNDLIPTCPHKH